MLYKIKGRSDNGKIVFYTESCDLKKAIRSKFSHLHFLLFNKICITRIGAERFLRKLNLQKER